MVHHNQNQKKDPNKIQAANPVKRRSAPAAGLAARTGNHAGRHHTRDRDLRRGSSRKSKHRNNRGW